ncbi:MAG TPA: hypothetical protein VIO94_12740 [Phenylobacterium sp.]
MAHTNHETKIVQFPVRRPEPAGKPAQNEPVAKVPSPPRTFVKGAAPY